MRSVSATVWLALVLAFLLGVTWMGRLEAGGPPRADLHLEGGHPATLYLPGPSDVFDRVLPPDERPPPAVLLVHGYSGDRAMMSILARRLARNGYGVLTLAVRGHGDNRNPFPDARGRPDNLFEDVKRGVDFLRSSAYVDGLRIVLMGHSMGAGAVLDYATRDSGIDASVLISGGWKLHGAYPPSNAFFIWAEGDPERVKERSTSMAAHLAGDESYARGERRGRFGRRDAVRTHEVPDTSHISIVWSADAAGLIIGWLDGVFEVERAGAPDLDEPRFRPLKLLLLLLPFLVWGTGSLVGALAAKREKPRFEGVAISYLWLVAALLAALPPLSLQIIANVIPVSVGDVVVSHQLLAGVALLGGLVLTGRAFLPRPLIDLRRELAPALLGFLAVVVLTVPMAPVVHDLTPTPERMLALLAIAALLFPFHLAFELLLRRGSTPVAAGSCVLGRLLVLAALSIGIALGIVPRVVNLMLPSLALVYFLLELLAAPLYQRSANRIVIALLASLWIARTIATTMPMRF